MSWNSTETPLELQTRIRSQQDHDDRERGRRRAAAELEKQKRPTHAPKKTLGEIHDPVERQNFIAQQRAEEKAKEEAHNARLMKERCYAAYVNAGGNEDFEAAYPAIRERLIQDEAVRALQGKNRA